MLEPEAGLAAVPACPAAQGPLAAAVAQAHAVAALTVVGLLVLQPGVEPLPAAAQAQQPAVAAQHPGPQAAPARRDYILRNVPFDLRVGRPP